MNERTMSGTGVVSGFAHAPAIWARPAVASPPSAPPLAPEAREAEVERFDAATMTVTERFLTRASQATGDAAEVLQATATLAKDRGWKRAAVKAVKAGVPAEQATWDAIEGFCTQLEKLGGLMAERTTDLRDIRDRVIAELMGLPEPGVPRSDVPSVLFADDLAPADTATLDPELVVALVTRLGGPTSHTAIIARQLGLPCVVAVADLESIPAGTPVLVDGATGTITASPDPAAAEALVAEEKLRREEVRAWRGPGRTGDGTPIQLLANIQNGAGALAAARSQAEGVGLFRTELSFLTAQVEPSVDEQARRYEEVFAAFADHKVVVRTLDAGSDKPVPFAHHAEEENPALGVRGIRLGRTNEGMLERQLDAIAAAVRTTGIADAWVMAPMISTVDEARDFAVLCRDRGLTPGIMVEVPAVAILADAFLAEVDFVSIGTNDLTQYTMAADRMSSDLATLSDPWQPAVLRLVGATAAAGARAGKPVGVCGEAAADPLLACVLAGLGVTSLSMAPGALPVVGVELGKHSLDQYREVAAEVIATRTAEEAKALAAHALA